MTNSLLLLCQAVLYFGVMACLFRLRGTIGIGVFMCALGVMHFLETYLAGVFYVETPIGMLSPGSTVLFSGKLAILLLLYIKEDAAAVRQPIYGLLLGNTLTVGLVLLLRFHDIAPLPDGAAPDIAFIDDMGWLMVWGTTLLYIDAILIILLYESLSGALREHLFLRVVVSVGLVLTVDQIGFFAALHFIADAPIEVFYGGWAGKMAAALAFSFMLVGYLRFIEPARLGAPRHLADIFGTLTFRERYEALVEHAGRDGLTGLLHRGRFDEVGEEAVAASMRSGKPLTLLIIDVDHFKSINDRFGHSEGDRVLKAIAGLVANAIGTSDRAFRIGGEEFAVLCPYPHAVGKLLGESIRHQVAAAVPHSCSVSIGVATLGPGHRNLDDLFSTADRRLYAAKSSGRDRVVGEAVDVQAGESRRA